MDGEPAGVERGGDAAVGIRHDAGRYPRAHIGDTSGVSACMTRHGCRAFSAPLRWPGVRLRGCRGRQELSKYGRWRLVGADAPRPQLSIDRGLPRYSAATSAAATCGRAR
jgi:hypothetical protein